MGLLCEAICFEVGLLGGKGLRQRERKGARRELGRHNGTLQIARVDPTALQFADLEIPSEDAIAQNIYFRIEINCAHA
jgi:hypothetical protein